jgi:hypothetical protein
MRFRPKAEKAIPAFYKAWWDVEPAWIHVVLCHFTARTLTGALWTQKL